MALADKLLLSVAILVLCEFRKKLRPSPKRSTVGFDNVWEKSEADSSIMRLMGDKLEVIVQVMGF